jgi:hypothetical protein
MAERGHLHAGGTQGPLSWRIRVGRDLGFAARASGKRGGRGSRSRRPRFPSSVGPNVLAAFVWPE